jgi:hypothetical protein
MEKSRVTRFTPGGAGGRLLSLTVCGISVHVIPRDAEEQEAAEVLAEQIASLGPAQSATPAAVPQVATVPAVTPAVATHVPFTVGEKVFCIVHGARGWYTVTEVGNGRHRGRIKISGERMWCPSHNFRRQEVG